MTINEYLHKLIRNQEISKKIQNKMRLDRENIEIMINSIEDLTKPTYYWGGSYGKKTMIKDSYDIDILCYFPADEPHSMEEIYAILRNHIISYEPNAYQKNVAIRIVKNDNYHIDIVTAKRISTNETMAYLYKSQDNRRLATSVEKQIHIVSDFGRRDLLKLVKLWKFRNNIDIPSFLVELIMIQVNPEDKITLEDGLKRVFQFIASRIETCNIPDPANASNNIASNEVSDPIEKRKAKIVAERCLSLDLQTIEGWKEVFKKKENLLSTIDNNLEEENDVGFEDSFKSFLKIGAGVIGGILSFKILKKLFSIEN